MALGVEGMRAGKVIRKAIYLTFGTAIFIFCLTLVFQSMRAVMDVGGACASGGAFEIRQECPEGVAWVMPVGIFGMLFAGIFTFMGVFPDGGPRPYVFAWSALFLALGWNFLEYGIDSPDGGTSVGWLICGVLFVIMGGVPLLFLLSPRAARWAFWGPNSKRADDYLHPYKPPPVRTAKAADTTPVPTATRSMTSYARPTPTFVPEPTPTPPSAPAQTKKNGRGDVVERLQTLADLRERGMLDDDEYERAKRAVLDDEASS